VKTAVVLYDVHDSDAAYYRESLGSDYDLTVTSQPLSEDTVALAKPAAVIAVHVSSPVTAGLMAQMPQLRHIACRTTGYDHIDRAYAKAHDITVSTVPSYGESTVAEYAFLLLMAASRRLVPAVHAVHSGAVAPEELTGHDLAGKTLGVVGTGRIGRHAIQIARGFGMTVVAYDPFPNAAAAKGLGYEYLPLGELLGRADCITLHAPSTPETHHLLDATALAKTKPGVIIVNTARGDLIDTPALIEALNSGQVAAVGLDVLEGEEYLQMTEELHLLDKKELGEDAKKVLGLNILSQMPNVLITSHNAYNSAEALGRIRDTAVANIRAWSAGHPQNLLT
jgi:D-lactate dehydrogenase